MVGTILKLMLTRGISIKRWNNFPRIEYITHMDNVGFSMHIALFLAHIQKQTTGEDVDELYLLKKLLFDSFKGLILADINAGTRDYILKIDSEIFEKVENKGLEKILYITAPENISQDIHSVITNKHTRVEHTIIAAAKKYAGFIEAQTNHRVYDVIYELPLQELKTSLESKRKELAALGILLENTGYQKYLAHIRRLSHAMRWSGESKLLPISVMSHLGEVMFLAYIIGMMNPDIDDRQLLEMLKKAIYHDIPEAITGDIINPTKKSVEGFAQVLETVERNMLQDYLFCHLPDSYIQEISPYIFTPFEDELGSLVKLADIFAAIFEAKIEVLFGNTREFETIFSVLQKGVLDSQELGVRYLLTHGMLEFENKNAIT